MAILFGILLFLSFLAAIIFGTNYITIRSILEQKGIAISWFFNWIFDDLAKFKKLIISEESAEKKAEYLYYYNWCAYAFLATVICVINAIVIFNVLLE
ncbi:hypothetical protein ULMA_10060 [Patiriisocius marinus]|uniref:Uncharacterized protein n=1 Tax=Patiriisocius marinus TaxID=1397112 RepID=A0A5J4IZ29_9FLAO|nr:hypothetical protein [Patiriisocius marinus]GER58898.1 hypothetical protein ULMA_10060 [Patiriisocius marinus]